MPEWTYAEWKSESHECADSDGRLWTAKDDG